MRCGLLCGAAALLLAPAVGRAQPDTNGTYDFPRSDPQAPLPLGHDRMENGGLFASAEFWFLKQTRPVGDQPIARRGFIDTDGTLSGTPGTVLGSGTVALSANSLGATSYQPGWSSTIGYRFQNGITFSGTYMNLIGVHYTGSASFVPPGFQTDRNLDDISLFAPVYNFPSFYAGPQQQTQTAAIPGQSLTSSNTYGIWNDAQEMSIKLTQRYTQVDLIARVPLFESDYSRVYGLAGGRFAWFWDRFAWITEKQGFAVIPGPVLNETVPLLDAFGNPIILTTVIVNANGSSTTTQTVATQIVAVQQPATTSYDAQAARYTNITSNRMYGPVWGCGHDINIGHGFSLVGEVTSGVLLDIVKTRAAYELLDPAEPAIQKKSNTEYRPIPHVNGNLNLYWDPIEAVRMRIGYNASMFFNTLGMKEPVDFNYGGLNPPYSNQFRILQGLNVGISLVF
jgi:hypothetical protein